MPDANDHDHQHQAGHHDHHRFESLAVFATVVRSPALVRVLLAFLLFSIAELATWVAILVYAFDRGGATASGLVAFAQLAPAVVFAPIGAALGDRIPRTRMLALAYGSYGALTFLAALLLYADAASLAVYAAAVLGGLALTLVRPAHAAVLPAIARTPSELTAANVASGTVENVGILVGSVAGGFMLAAVGTGGVYLLSALALLVAFLATVTMRPVVVVRRRRLELAIEGGGTDEPDGTEDPSDDGHHVHDGHELPGITAPAGVMREIGAGIAVIHADPHTRAVVLILALSMMLVGMLDVLGVVLALDVLEAGEQAVGLLAGASGAGGLLGAALAISLVGRPRLVGSLLASALVIGIGIGASGLIPLLAVALAGFLAGGIGKSVFDVAGRTMLQRVAPDEKLARIFGVLEGLNMAALAAGTLLVPILVGLVGSTVALLVAAAIVPVAALALRPWLVGADRAGVVHERELALIRKIPMFAPLRVTVLERLAQELNHMHVSGGTEVIREGDRGDRFYIIAEGRCEVLVRGRVVNTIGSGEGFGEIALVNDIPRTATVRAIDDLDLFVLDREPFLEAVTGQPRSRAEAQRLIDERLAMHD
jgi:MFS family permease